MGLVFFISTASVHSHQNQFISTAKQKPGKCNSHRVMFLIENNDLKKVRTHEKKKLLFFSINTSVCAECVEKMPASHRFNFDQQKDIKKILFPLSL